MINLLPSAIKQEYRFARRNRRLVQWSMMFVLAIVGVALLTAIGLMVMDNSIDQNQQAVADAQARLDSQHADETEKEVAAITTNLKLMVNVLSKEVLFSELLAQLGSITPPSAALSNLSISQTAGAIDITAHTKSYDAAAQLQANYADPTNKIFTSADIVNISCADSQNTDYPCTITLRALFAADNPFLFINNGKAAQP